MTPPSSPRALRWPLPVDDYWSTPFAESLLQHLQLAPGLSILDLAAGEGIPALYLAEQVGPTGTVVGLDVSPQQIARARAIQRHQLPWLRFEEADMRALPASLPCFDRITGNLSVMFLRPHRFEAVQGVVTHLKPGGQLVLTFPSLGTFASLWDRIDEEMARQGQADARERLRIYLAERPSVAEVQGWLARLPLERCTVTEYPLFVTTGAGAAFRFHPLLRGGFLDDAYECFDDPLVAEAVMTAVSDDIESFVPLLAQRCVVSGWAPVA